MGESPSSLKAGGRALGQFRQAGGCLSGDLGTADLELSMELVLLDFHWRHIRKRHHGGQVPLLRASPASPVAVGAGGGSHQGCAAGSWQGEGSSG